MASVLGSEVVTQLKAVIDVYIFKSSKAANLQLRESWTFKSQQEVENQSRSTVMAEPPSSQMVSGINQTCSSRGTMAKAVAS